MKLLVVRHAIAMDKADFHAVESNDELRPLTNEGAKKMKKNAKGLAEIIASPDLLVTSPLTRARQTAEILTSVWENLIPVVCEDLKPGSEPADFVKWVRSQPIHRDSLVAIVGHEPHLSSLVSWFLTGSQKSLLEMKKGGACLLHFDSTVEKGRGQLKWLLTPPQLRG